MDPDSKRALAILDACRSRPAKPHPIVLTADYLRAIERVEALPENQSGTDKSWIWHAIMQARHHFAKAVRVR